MNVKGFLMEDDYGQEFVVVCEKPHGQPGKVFALRGWQRRRMVPLRYTGPELRHITGEVLRTLDGLFRHLLDVGVDPQDRPPSHSGLEGIRTGGVG
ncbi:MAG TPA: hypothetical protein VFX56_07950 [Nitrospira sp.]|nr:hypothetical protein [Nitrospira sp.]